MVSGWGEHLKVLIICSVFSLGKRKSCTSAFILAFYLYLVNSDNRWQHICEKLHSCLLLILLCRSRGKGVVGKAGQSCEGVGRNPIVGRQSTEGQTVVRQPLEAKGGD